MPPFSLVFCSGVYFYIGSAVGKAIKANSFVRFLFLLPPFPCWPVRVVAAEGRLSLVRGAACDGVSTKSAPAALKERTEPKGHSCQPSASIPCFASSSDIISRGTEAFTCSRTVDLSGGIKSSELTAFRMSP